MTNNKVNIFLVDDHHIFREGIRSLFNEDSDIDLIGEAGDGSEIIDKIQDLEVDVLLLDIDMPNISGLQIIESVTKQFPAINILVFSMHDNDVYIREMLAKGAKGYILKSCRKEELFRAIKTVRTGDTYLSEEVSKILFTSRLDTKKQKLRKSKSPLTNREIEVLKLVATGLTNHVIGEQLKISHRTVDTHRRNIMEKLNLHNAVALANYASKKGFLKN